MIFTQLPSSSLFACGKNQLISSLPQLSITTARKPMKLK